MQQEIFEFPQIDRLDWSDFVVSEENRKAVRYLIEWPNWESNGIIIYGESGTGKTHLAALWAQTANAVYILKESLNYDPRDLFNAECNFVLDNFDYYLKNQNWLFHFLNIIKEKKRYFLILSRNSPMSMDVDLKDLKSRIFSSVCVNIKSPGDDLLLKISRKIAKDLQISVSDNMLEYILALVDRKVTCISNVLKMLDKLSLRLKVPLSISFAKKYLQLTGN
ncbi:MAG: hypothetical protein LBF57_00985 [Holosporaceae bacterium]|jgi:chromosomal replication initiation ATPase DnaA|nr:hypothetical protein [Holosporaceae bacterium]